MDRGRIPTREVVPYIVFQIAGAVAAAAVLKIMAEGHHRFVLGGFTSNGYVDLNLGHYNLLSCAIIETVLTFFFLIVILEATSAGAPSSFAVLAIGLALTIIQLISIRSATPRSIPRVAPVRRSSPAKPISNSVGSSCWRRR